MHSRSGSPLTGLTEPAYKSNKSERVWFHKLLVYVLAWLQELDWLLHFCFFPFLLFFFLLEIGKLILHLQNTTLILLFSWAFIGPIWEFTCWRALLGKLLHSDSALVFMPLLLRMFTWSAWLSSVSDSVPNSLSNLRTPAPELVKTGTWYWGVFVASLH